MLYKTSDAIDTGTSVWQYVESVMSAVYYIPVRQSGSKSNQLCQKALNTNIDDWITAIDMDEEM